MTSIQALFTNRIEDAGVNFNVYFVAGIMRNDSFEWHYFGVTESQMPRSELEPNIPARATAPFFEHGVVAFPRDFKELPNTMFEQLYNISVPAGLNREGVW